MKANSKKKFLVLALVFFTPFWAWPPPTRKRRGSRCWSWAAPRYRWPSMPVVNATKVLAEAAIRKYQEMTRGD